MSKKSPPPPTTVGFGALADALRARGLASATPIEPAPVPAPVEPLEAPPTGKVHVRRETKGRAGKTVTVVYNAPFRGVALGAWVAKVRMRLGTGASIEGDTVVIQGDHVARVLALIEDPSP